MLNCQAAAGKENGEAITHSSPARQSGDILPSCSASVCDEILNRITLNYSAQLLQMAITLHYGIRDALPHQFVCFFIKFINGL